MTKQKGVLSADVKSGINKLSFPPTNDGDHIKITKLVNLLQSSLRCLERIRKSQDAKEAEESQPKKINAFTAKI